MFARIVNLIGMKRRQLRRGEAEEDENREDTEEDQVSQSHSQAVVQRRAGKRRLRQVVDDPDEEKEEEEEEQEQSHGSKRARTQQQNRQRRQNRRQDDDEDQEEEELEEEAEEEEEPTPSTSALVSAPVTVDEESEAHHEEEEVDKAALLDFTQSQYALESSQRSSSSTSSRRSSQPREGRREHSIPARIQQMSEKTIDDMTALLVRYFLYKASQKLPIRFGDISKDVFPRERNVSRFFFARAKKQLEQSFGYRVVAVDGAHDTYTSASQSITSKEMYLVVNSVTDQQHLVAINNNGSSAQRGLLMMILGLLWCAQEHRLAEEDLWKQLALLDGRIRVGRNHPVLGDIGTALKTFESQLYLQSRTEVDSVELKKVRFYSYAPRAFLEVGEAAILTFVCKLVTQRQPTQHQLDELLK